MSILFLNFNVFTFLHFEIIYAFIIQLCQNVSKRNDYRFIRTTYKFSIYKMGFGRLIIARYSGWGSSPIARDYGSSGAKSIDLKFLKFTFLFFIISYYLTSKIRNIERYQKIYKEIFCVL